MKSRTAIPVLGIAIAACFAPAKTCAAEEARKGYITSLPSESLANREARHEKIAERRKDSVVIVHRGASAFAPENTLEAYAAAMDYGADGCEIDIRRTADGVFVQFHDDGLDRMTDALGRIKQYTYRELVALKFRSLYEAKPETRVPTLAAVFALARQWAMLLHLDIKEPGLEEEIAGLLDAADIWDHVVAINDYNSADLRGHPRFKPLAYKSSGLQESRLDMDPEKVKEALAKPGNMIIVDDPRVAARELKRPVQRVPLPDNLNARLLATSSAISRDTNSFSPPQFLRALSKRVDGRSLAELEKVLDFPAHADLEGDAAHQQERTARILERAWAAQRVGQRGTKSKRALELLERLVTNRSLHRDWAYHGLDGVMAVRGLGAMHATESVPVLVKTFFAVDPELKKLVQPPANYPFAWGDFRLKFEIMTTLGELPCEQSKNFLLDYVTLDEAAAGKFAPPLFEEATKSLLRQNLAQAELRHLLQSTNSAVRGTAILECLDHPTASRTASMKTVLPWTQELPRAAK